MIGVCVCVCGSLGGTCVFLASRDFWLPYCDMFVLRSAYILQIKDELRARKEFDLI